MNLNKNNIKYYFSENKMKKMIENLEHNLENDEELRIRIEKYKKDSKPQSAKNGLFSFTGTNNSTNQSIKNEEKLTNNISDIDNINKKQKIKIIENLSSQRESENSFDSLKFSNQKINKKNTFYQIHSKHSYLTNLYLKKNNATLDYIPFNKKMTFEVNNFRKKLKNNNLNFYSIDNSNIKNIYNNDNNNDSKNKIKFQNVNNNISIQNSFNSYINNINNTYKNFQFIRPRKKTKLNKTQRVLNLPEIQSKLTNKSCNNETIENCIKSFDNENKTNLLLEDSMNNKKKIKTKKSNIFKDLKNNNYSPVIKKKKYEKFATLSYQKKRRSLESKNELNIENNLYQFNIDMNKNVSDNYIDQNVNKKFLDYFQKNLISKNKEININKNYKCVTIVNKKIDIIFYDNEKKINILEQKITNLLNNKLLNDQNLLNKKVDFNIENNASIRENQILYYNYIKVLNKEYEINDEIFIKQNIKEYILNKYYDIIEDIFNYCYKTKNKHKKFIFNSYANKVIKINKIVNKKLHSLTYNKNIEQNYKKKNSNYEDIKTLYFQAKSNFYNKSFFEKYITRDVNYQLYKKNKNINFVEYIKKIFPINRSFNKKVTLHKNSMKIFHKTNSKQLKSQFSHTITTNQQLSKTSPNLISNNNNSVSSFKKYIYSNLNMNEIIKSYEKKKSYKLNKENFQDSITKKILIIGPKKIKKYKSKFDIDMKETYTNNDIIIPDFSTEKILLNNKEFETISSTNKYITTQNQTDNIETKELTNLGKDIMEIIKNYIKNNNEILAIKIIKDHLEYINLNYKNKEGMTLLLLAIKYNCSDNLIQFLLDKGAEPNIFDVRILYNINYNIIYHFSSKEILHYTMLFLIKILKLLIC